MRTLEFAELTALARASASPLGWLAALGGAARCLWPGRDRGRRRAVVTLLHGNEPSGTVALFRLLREGIAPAVDVLLVLGAVPAALAAPGFALRVLPGRRDLNRCFTPPSAAAPDEEGALAGAIVAALRARPLEALVDLHNNTGHNPLYGVVTEADEARLALVGLFGSRCVRSHLRLGTLLEVTEDLRAVTIECGRAGDPAADQAAQVGLARFLQAEQLPLVAGAMEVFDAPLRLELRREARVAFGAGPEPAQDLVLHDDLDRHNFTVMRPGESLGWLGERGVWPLRALDERGADVSQVHFVAAAGRLQVREPLVPIMMTTDLRAAAGDCLCYLVKRRPG